MSETREIDGAEPPAGPRRLPRIETVRSIWGHVLKEGEPHQNAFAPSYFRAAAQQLKSGDQIHVSSFDRKVQFTVLVLDCNPEADPIHLEMAFAATFPVDLPVPPPIVQQTRFRVRQRSIDGAFEIWDGKLGERVAAGLRKEDALRQAATLDRTAREAAAAEKIVPGASGKPGKGPKEVPTGWYEAEL